MTDPFVERALAGKPIDNCLVIDAHGHLGENMAFGVPDPSAEGMIRQMDRVGVDQFWCSSVIATAGDGEGGNRTIAEAMKKFPGRICGYAAVDVHCPDKVQRQLEWCREAGFRALKIYSASVRHGPDYSHPWFTPVYQFAEAHRMPVLVHTWGKTDLEPLRPALEKYPSVQFLLAHTASADKPLYIEFARKYPNAWLELCLSSAPRGLVEDLVAQGLEDRLIWGSDCIFFDFKQQIGRVLMARITPQQKEKILGLNARKVLG